MDKKNHIECSVSNCRHHGEGKACQAKKVVIAPDRADKCKDTDCETFECDK